MAAIQDVVRRLTVVATDRGLTALRTSLNETDRAFERVAASSMRTATATEIADRRIRDMAVHAQRYMGSFNSGGLSGVAQAASADASMAAAAAGRSALTTMLRLAPAVGAVVGGVVLLNKTIERGTELLDKYGLAGQRAMYGIGVEEDLKMLTRFQTDDGITQRQVNYATELSTRLDDANRKIADFFKVQFSLTEPALKLQHAWVLVTEQIARAVEVAGRMPAPAVRMALPAVPVVGSLLSSGKALYDQLGPSNPAQPGIEELREIGRRRLAAGMGGGFAGHFNYSIMALGDRNRPKRPEMEGPEKPETATSRRTEYDRVTDSIRKQVEAMEIEAKTIAMTRGEAAQYRSEQMLRNAATASGIGLTAAQNEKITETAQRFADAARMREGASLTLDYLNADPLKSLERELVRLDELLQAGAVSWEVYGFHANKAMTSAAADAMSQVGSIATSLGKLFGDSKEFALAGAVIDTAAGVTKALGASPPPLNFLNAAAVGAAGAVQIATIMNARPGSGGGGGGRGVSGGGAAQQTQAVQGQEGRSLNVTINGDTFGRQQIRELVDQIREYGFDGGAKVNIG